MIPDIGIMVGAYIIFRVVERVLYYFSNEKTKAFSGILLVLLGAIVVYVALLGISDLLTVGQNVPLPPP